MRVNAEVKLLGVTQNSGPPCGLLGFDLFPTSLFGSTPSGLVFGKPLANPLLLLSRGQSLKLSHAPALGFESFNESTFTSNSISGTLGCGSLPSLLLDGTKDLLPGLLLLLLVPPDYSIKQVDE